jgi:GNAT superfamily N-acetyltransferase
MWRRPIDTGEIMASLTIETVQSSRQWDDFFSLKRAIYRHDPAAVIPLRKMERLQVDRERNAFYQHAQMEAFICYRDGQPVGRIAAIVDQLHQQYHQDDVGFFGFFEAIDDQLVVHRLVSTATVWLQQRGCRAIRGPVNPSMKSDFGVLVEGHSFPPAIMMGHSPARYDQQLEAEGFAVVKSFYAFHIVFSEKRSEIEPKIAALQKSNSRFIQRFPKLTFRQVSASNYESTLREINELGNRVRSVGWGFVPLTPEELDFMIKSLRQVIRFDMIHVAYWEDRLVGYIVNIPDANWALQRTIGRWDWLRMMQLPFLIRRTPKTRVIALGVDEEFRTKGIAMLLINRLTDLCEQFDEWEFSWVQEDNLKSIRAIGRALPLNRTKTYRLYQKPID